MLKPNYGRLRMPTVVDYGCSKTPTKRHVVDQHVVDHVVDQLIDHTEKVDHVVDQLIDHTEKVDHVVDQLIDHPDPPPTWNGTGGQPCRKAPRLGEGLGSTQYVLSDEKVGATSSPVGPLAQVRPGDLLKHSKASCEYKLPRGQPSKKPLGKQLNKSDRRGKPKCHSHFLGKNETIMWSTNLKNNFGGRARIDLFGRPRVW